MRVLSSSTVSGLIASWGWTAIRELPPPGPSRAGEGPLDRGAQCLNLPGVVGEDTHQRGADGQAPEQLGDGAPLHRPADRVVDADREGVRERILRPWIDRREVHLEGCPLERRRQCL